MGRFSRSALIIVAALAVGAGLAAAGMAAASPASTAVRGAVYFWSRDGVLHIDDRFLECTRAPDGSVYAVGKVNENPPATGDILLVKFAANGDWVWERVYHVPGSVSSTAGAIAADANDNVVVTGSIWNGADYDMFTAKWDAAGTLVWYALEASAGTGWDGGNDVVTDNVGNVYVAGDMDSWSEGVVVKYAAAADPANPGHGKQLWMHHFLGTAAFERAEAVAIARDSLGRVYVFGDRATATGGEDLYVARLRASGGTVWLRGWNSYRKRGDYATSMVVGKGGIWVAGNIDTPKHNSDVALLHFSTTGHRDWVRTWDDSLHKDENVDALRVDRYGDAYLANAYWPTSSAYKAVLIKFAHSGARRWVRLYRGVTGADGGLQCSDMAVSSGGTAWLVGTQFGSGDAFWRIVKYSRAGKRVWASGWPNGAPGDPQSGQPWACVLSDTDELFVAGDAVQTVGGRNAVAGWFVR